MPDAVGEHSRLPLRRLMLSQASAGEIKTPMSYLRATTTTACPSTRKGPNHMKAIATMRPSLFRFLTFTSIAVVGTVLCAPDRVKAAGAETRGFLPADRATIWKPGMMAVGGIPARSTVCATLSPNNPAKDDT